VPTPLPRYRQCKKVEVSQAEQGSDLLLEVLLAEKDDAIASCAGSRPIIGPSTAKIRQPMTIAADRR
jgi:hypothetical protein